VETDQKALHNQTRDQFQVRDARDHARIEEARIAVGFGGSKSG